MSEKRPGAQPGNTNSVTTGHKTKRVGATLATLGRKHASAYFDVCKLRQSLRALVRQKLGVVTVGAELQIQTACRHEASCRLAEQMIRENPKLAPMDVLKIRESISRWAAQRDSAINRLVGFDASGPTVDPFASLDAEAERRLSEPTDTADASIAATSAVGRQAADQASDPFAEIDAEFSDNYGNADAEGDDDE